MSSKSAKRRTESRTPQSTRAPHMSARPRDSVRPSRRRSSKTWWVAGGAVVAVVAVVAIAALGLFSNSPRAPAAGTWTNIQPERLATMLQHKDFTLLNVKTPYFGEIAGTDLYIPYDRLPQLAGQLPTSKTAPIVVYCRTGHESAIAAQTLLELGYTNIYNLDGGMTAWTASGRQLISLDRGGS